MITEQIAQFKKLMEIFLFNRPMLDQLLDQMVLSGEKMKISANMFWASKVDWNKSSTVAQLSRKRKWKGCIIPLQLKPSHHRRAFRHILSCCVSLPVCSNVIFDNMLSHILFAPITQSRVLILLSCVSSTSWCWSKFLMAVSINFVCFSLFAHWSSPRFPALMSFWIFKVWWFVPFCVLVMVRWILSFCIPIHHCLR